MDKDLINRQQAIKEVKELFSMGDCYCDEYAIVGMLNTMPSIQLEPAIPLLWIENHIAYLKSLDNAFSTLTAMQISTMVKKWKDKQDEND